MVSYRNMTDKDIDNYRKKSIIHQLERQKEYEKYKNDGHKNRMIYVFGDNVYDCYNLELSNKK